MRFLWHEAQPKRHKFKCISRKSVLRWQYETISANIATTTLPDHLHLLSCPEPPLTHNSDPYFICQIWGATFCDGRPQSSCLWPSGCIYYLHLSSLLKKIKKTGSVFVTITSSNVFPHLLVYHHFLPQTSQSFHFSPYPSHMCWRWRDYFWVHIDYYLLCFHYLQWLLSLTFRVMWSGYGTALGSQLPVASHFSTAAPAFCWC